MSILDMSLAGAVFIIAVVVVRVMLINRIPKRAFLVLWEIAFLRLIIPFTIPFRFSIYTLINQMLSGFGLVKTESDTAITALTQGNSIAIRESGAISLSVPPATSIWFVIWCMGMILSVSFFAVAYFRCRLEFQASLPVCNDYVEQWLKEHAIRRSISVRHSDRILTPLTYGVLRPVILMPKTTDWENTEQLQYVLVHEYMHICHFVTISAKTQ
ncbi:MAG: M56 family metallopeptidase [Clostridiales bacterium]|nr:M56 family metallopeptidase [Clostridiales bacterium]